MIPIFFKYSGNKRFLIPLFKELESQIENKGTYIEPFGGSGIIALNTSNDFNKIILNDQSKYICSIYRAFQSMTDYSYLISKIENVFERFGNIKECKECYYNFRNWANSEFNEFDVDSGIYMYMLANSTINSLFRVGPNGFNNSYGNRFSYLNEENFIKVINKIKTIEIYNEDYRYFLTNSPDTLYFLDPPYLNNGKNAGYKSFNQEAYKDFISWLNLIQESNFIYTDTLKPENEKFNKMIIREYLSIAPSSRDKSSTEEYLFLSKNLKIPIQKEQNTKLF